MEDGCPLGSFFSKILHPAFFFIFQTVLDGSLFFALQSHSNTPHYSAKIMKGRKSTCFVAIKDDIINAGAEYSEERCVTDGNMCVPPPLSNRSGRLQSSCVALPPISIHALY